MTKRSSIPQLQADISKLHDQQRSVNADIQHKTFQIKEIIANLHGMAPWDVGLGGHKCHGSPTLACIYNLKTDPSKDDCLYCHNPAERK